MDFCRHVNPFRICTGLKIIGYFMIILVAGIISMSYIAVIVIAWGPQIYHEGIFSSSSLLAALIVVVFHILLVLLIWSYTMVVYRDPGSVPVNWSSNMSEESVETGNSTTLSHNDALKLAILLLYLIMMPLE
ncbi:hypothetical protein ZOSMA_1G02560 [Zostera marina]|uniref:Palmitoyltransferase n=1 Tax=Zostera marina TaxID=29655 RepID=A0A0K9PMU8_ZOSMR|nr:hypothetical protein ZOSMA_1G02560 [Zostera marina]